MRSRSPTDKDPSWSPGVLLKPERSREQAAPDRGRRALGRGDSTSTWLLGAGLVPPLPPRERPRLGPGPPRLPWHLPGCLVCAGLRAKPRDRERGAPSLGGDRQTAVCSARPHETAFPSVWEVREESPRGRHPKVKSKGGFIVREAWGRVGGTRLQEEAISCTRDVW